MASNQSSVTSLPTRRQIEVRKNALRSMAEESVKALSDVHLYNRGGLLVRVMKSEKVTPGLRRAPEAYSLVPCGEQVVKMFLSDHAEFFKIVGATNAQRRSPQNPPSELVRALIEAPDRLDFQHLSGITSAPLLMADGSWHGQRGYAAGYLLLMEEGTEFMAPALRVRRHCLLLTS